MAVNEANLSGWLLIDKPLGMSSAKVVSIVKRNLNAKKVGHSGTLDPAASGLLMIAVGKATKLISYAMNDKKQYSFTVKWGEATDTDDAEGEIVSVSDKIPSREEIISIIGEFQGEIMQVPPQYSAVKISGKRAYQLARSGEDVQLKERSIIVDKLELSGFVGSEATFLLDCSKGTYVRSIARDMATKLGTFGHVTALRREKIGKFSVEDAILLDKFKENVYKISPCDLLMPMDIVLDDIPVCNLGNADLESLKNGLSVYCDGEYIDGEKLAVKNRNNLVSLSVFNSGKIKSIKWLIN